MVWKALRLSLHNLIPRIRESFSWCALAMVMGNMMSISYVFLGAASPALAKVVRTFPVRLDWECVRRRGRTGGGNGLHWFCRKLAGLELARRYHRPPPSEGCSRIYRYAYNLEASSPPHYLFVKYTYEPLASSTSYGTIRVAKTLQDWLPLPLRFPPLVCLKATVIPAFAGSPDPSSNFANPTLLLDYSYTPPASGIEDTPQNLLPRLYYRRRGSLNWSPSICYML
ncbi:hypothetical protein BS47DRAFT_1112895 [Hydnum rufescens UP504]|uniref:Uncharacterized protein n=1 Tax=Hydnum rufescens UP504 TaxID=1448309 RepID=A0A9P6DUY8_9AGAM|nr:hypothetical protein BS47DRAFT_1112895 [Hydnum rufescens UP504]